MTPQHTYQILTKRPERMAEYFNDRYTKKDYTGDRLYSNGHVGDIVRSLKPTLHKFVWPLPNVWLGTSVENQQTADERIPHLLNCPAAVRFLSCEPLLGVVDLRKWLMAETVHCHLDKKSLENKEFMSAFEKMCHRAAGTISGLHWVIAGGESGPKARPMHPAWVRSLRDQCEIAGVAFFFKQWGQYAAHDTFPIPLRHICKQSFYTENGAIVPVKPSTSADKMASFPIFCKVGKHNSGRILDGKEHSEFPQS
jgi:protein gp37